MAKAKNKSEEKELTSQERLDLFVMGVKRLAEQYKIGMEPTMKPEWKFIDLMPKKDQVPGEPVLVEEVKKDEQKNEE
jgi:hypothetical protein